MPKYPGQPNRPTMYLIKFTPRFEMVDFSLPIQNTYEIQTQLQALEAEARAKDSVIVVQVSLVPEDEFFQEPTDEKGDLTDEQPTQPND